MEIIEALDKLDFSFWQIVIVFGIFFLRNEIKEVIKRITLVKIGNNELSLYKTTELAKDLADIQADLNRPDQDLSSIKHSVESKINNNTHAALSSIKHNTSFLWGDLSENSGPREVRSEIRKSTLFRIKNDLDYLSGIGHIQYEKTAIYESFDSDTVFLITVNVVNSESLDPVIQSLNSRKT